MTFTKNNSRSLLAAFIICLSISVRAQDIHFSQFYNAPLSLSPALTGINGGDIRFAGTYRKQWNNALAAFTTFHFSVDAKIFNPRMDKGFFSAGLLLFNDDAGDTNLSTLTVGVTGSYTRRIDSENFLTIGVLVGVSQRQFDTGGLTFDRQYNGDSFDPGSPTFENFNNDDILYPDIGAGVNWHGQKTNKRSKLDVGAAVYHLNSPNQNFLDNGPKSSLPARFSLYLRPSMQVAKNWDIVLSGTAQIQQSYVETVAGGAGRWYMNNEHPSKQIAMLFGMGVRFNSIGDAVIPRAEFRYHYWNFGFSYDINVSGFSAATNRNGGPEFSLRYIIQKVRPHKSFKNCPLI